LGPVPKIVHDIYAHIPKSGKKSKTLLVPRILDKGYLYYKEFLLLSLCCSKGSLSVESLSNLPEITEIGSGIAET
jgi:hypothetical protein